MAVTLEKPTGTKKLVKMAVTLENKRLQSLKKW